MRIIADPKFVPVVRRFRNESKAIVGTEIDALVRSAAVAAKKEARLHLKDLVYTAPLPPAAARMGLAKYLAMDSGGYRGRRTGAIWRAVKTRRVAPMIADMFVDQSDTATGPEAYYYAWIMNFGGKNIDYPTLPFFTITVKVMRARFTGLGKNSLLRMKGGLLGYTNPAVAGDVLDG